MTSRTKQLQAFKKTEVAKLYRFTGRLTDLLKKAKKFRIPFLAELEILLESILSKKFVD